jgi:hypothetical protein
MIWCLYYELRPATTAEPESSPFAIIWPGRLVTAPFAPSTYPGFGCREARFVPERRRAVRRPCPRSPDWAAYATHAPNSPLLADDKRAGMG